MTRIGVHVVAYNTSSSSRRVMGAKYRSSSFERLAAAGALGWAYAGAKESARRSWRSAAGRAARTGGPPSSARRTRRWRYVPPCSRNQFVYELGRLTRPDERDIITAEGIEPISGGQGAGRDVTAPGVPA